jgi:hypothetical protein
VGANGWSLQVITRAHKIIQSTNTKERSLCNDTLTEKKIILKFILKRQGLTSWIGFMWYRANTEGGLM